MTDFKKVVSNATPLFVELTRYLLSGVYRDLEKQAMQIARRLYFLHVFTLVSAIFSILSVLTIVFMGAGWLIGAIGFASLNLLFFVTACVVLLFSTIVYFRVKKFVNNQTPENSHTQMEKLIEQVALLLKKFQEDDGDIKKANTQSIERRIEAMENSILLLIQALETRSQPDLSLKYSKIRDL